MRKIATTVAALTILIVVSFAAAGQAGQLAHFRPGDQVHNEATRSRSPRIESLSPEKAITTFVTRPAFRTSQCTVFVDYPQYALYDWMTGFELYEEYHDLRYPLITCDSTYPFMVTDVGLTVVYLIAYIFSGGPPPCQ